DLLHCGAYKSASEIFMRTGPSPEADEMTNWLLDSLYDTQIDLIAKGRSVPPEKVRSWIDAGLYSGEKAKDAGLVDAVEERTELESLLKSKYGDSVTFDKKYGQKPQPKIDFNNPFALFKVFGELMAGEKETSNKPAIGIV